MKLKQNKIKGFTLIELLIVIAIIGLLAAVIFASLANSRSRARDARRIADVRQMMSGLELYYTSVGNYPIQASLQAVVGGVSTGIGLLSPNYIATFQSAPTPADNCTTAANTYYYSSAAGTTYTLTFCLGNITGSYVAGTHTAGPNGIQ